MTHPPDVPDQFGCKIEKNSLDILKYLRYIQCLCLAKGCVMEMVQKLLRLPVSLAAQAEQQAEALGLSLNDVIVTALGNFLGVETDRGVTMLQQLSEWVSSNYNRQSFPQDVTFHVFQHIRQRPELLTTYESL